MQGKLSRGLLVEAVRFFVTDFSIYYHPQDPLRRARNFLSVVIWRVSAVSTTRAQNRIHHSVKTSSKKVINPGKHHTNINQAEEFLWRRALILCVQPGDPDPRPPKYRPAAAELDPWIGQLIVWVDLGVRRAWAEIKRHPNGNNWKSDWPRRTEEGNGTGSDRPLDGF